MEFNDFYSDFAGYNYDNFANAGGDVIKSAPPQSVLRETASDGSRDTTGGLFKGIGQFLGSDQGKAVLAGVKAGTNTTPASTGGAGGGGGDDDKKSNFWENNKTPIIIGGVLILGVTAFLIFKK
jgi:hypothetical protein